MSLVVIVRKNYTMDLKAYQCETCEQAVDKIREEYAKELTYAGNANNCNSYLSEKDMYAQINYGVEETEIRATELE